MCDRGAVVKAFIMYRRAPGGLWFDYRLANFFLCHLIVAIMLPYFYSVAEIRLESLGRSRYKTLPC